jgi:hypothetical membrane protein
MAKESTTEGLDVSAAVTRSMLGWGVVAGPFYLSVGLILALTRPWFDLTRDALSLLLIGDIGWLQASNLILSGAMSLVAAIGLWRTPDWSRASAALVGVYGLCLVLSAIFPPDPTKNFPPSSAGGAFTGSGIAHLAFGAIGFLCLGAAAVLAGGWFRRRGSSAATWSRSAGVLLIVAFIAGVALAAGPAGVAFIWLTVLIGWAWLAATSVAAYRAIPHPVLAHR